MSGRLKTFAIVGYTNAGKSSLFNRLTKADVLAKNQLFATLDTTARRLYLNPSTSIILTDTVGFVAPVPIPEVVRNIDAFALGAQSVNPTARVKVAWVNGWADPVRETEATQTLISGGADVIIYNTATTDPLKQAERVGKYAFGWGADMSQSAPKAHLGSVAFDWAGYYVQTVQQVLDKRWKPAPTWQGLRDGRVDLVALSDKLAPEARAAVEEKRKALRDGTLQIWKGPLVTVDDRELLPSGKVGDDRFLEGLMTYVKGVEGQVPAGR